jgi:hypothetical protein
MWGLGIKTGFDIEVDTGSPQYSSSRTGFPVVREELFSLGKTVYPGHSKTWKKI